MSTLQETLFNNNHAVTISMQGLADGSKAISDVIDNSVNRFIQADIQVKFKTNQHKINPSGTVSIGILRSVDGGVTFDSHLRPGNIIATIDQLDADTTYVVSASTHNIGLLPSHFKVSVRNDTGQPLFHKDEKFSVVYAGKNILEVASTASM